MHLQLSSLNIDGYAKEHHPKSGYGVCLYIADSSRKRKQVM